MYRARCMEVAKGNEVVMREYRKGNWTVDETLVLIDAKKLDKQRRTMKGASSKANSTSMKAEAGGGGGGGELRWKWVEDYCWEKGCLRSQNQCNDKWDNLMRDFKKVREFERPNHNSPTHTSSSSSSNKKSYWNMDKTERKHHNLPSNMLPHIYEALAHVVEAKFGISIHPPIVFHPPTTTTAATTTAATPLPPPPPPPPPAAGSSQALPTEELSAKRRRLQDGGIQKEVSASACVLAEAIKGYEEREEARHKELYSLHQKMFKIEESKIELERQGFNGLVDAINNLSNSILAFTSQTTPP